MTVVTGGMIQITYGGQANSKISGCLLSLTPYSNTNNDVLWQCGLASAPASATAATAGGSAGNTVKPQYLPTICHS